MDLSACLEVLKATQSTDSPERKAAEDKLDDAVENSPDQLAGALVGVLASADVASELRQEAAIILVQLVQGRGPKPSAWPRLEATSKKALMEQALQVVKQDTQSKVVRRAAGQVISAGVEMAADSFDEVATEFPGLLQELARLVGPEIADAQTRVVVLRILCDCVDTIGEGLLSQGSSPFAMLSASLGDSDADVRTAGVELLLHLTDCACEMPQEESEEIRKALAQLMPPLIEVMKVFATNKQEENLKAVLQCMQSVVEQDEDSFEEDDEVNKVALFFKETCLEPLWVLLLEICSKDSETFTDSVIPHSAMEICMELCESLDEEFEKTENQAALERLISINMEWMTRIEADISVWTAECEEEDDDDDCDEEESGIGEENLDRFGETFAEELFMPILFKVIRENVPPEGADWKAIRSSIIAISQVMEHLTESSWIEQCYNHIIKYSEHDHPRVRYAVFQAITQMYVDHSDSSNLDFITDADLLAAVLKGMHDDNIRVVTNAVSTFTACSDEVDTEELGIFVPEFLTQLTQLLKQTQSANLQEICLSAIAMCADAADEEMDKCYADLMPILKEFAEKVSGEKQRLLQGKTFECIAGVGEAVGKHMFQADVAEIMQALMQLLQAESAPEDTARQSFQLAASEIAKTMGKDFKPYVPALMPVIFKALNQKPTAIDDPDDDGLSDKEDYAYAMVGDSYFGLRTSLVEEMEEAMEFLSTLISNMEEDFCEFMPATCKAVMPLLEFQFSEDIRSEAFNVWEAMVKSARAAVDAQRIPASVLQEMVNEFLKSVLGAISKEVTDADTDDFGTSKLSNLQARAVGAAAVIRGAGAGVLTSDAVKDISNVLAQVFLAVKCSSDGQKAEPSARRGRGSAVKLDDDENEDDEKTFDGKVFRSALRQSVRYCCADVVGAMMRTARDAFLEVSLSGFIEIIKQFISKDRPEADRALAFYMADDLVDSLEEHSIGYWDLIMNQALDGMTDKCALIRQYATRTIGNGARHIQLKPMVRAVALKINEILQKQGERHRRRRAVKADTKQTSLAVEAAIRALGQICEFHEAEFGTDAGFAWNLWLAGLPCKYDVEEGTKAHRQLLELVVKNHPILTAPEKLPQVLSILADVYKTKFSNKLLDLQIAGAVLQVENPIKELCGSMPEKQQKKVEQILKEAKTGAKAGSATSAIAGA